MVRSLLALAALAAAGCHDSGSAAPPLAAATIGAGGGTLAVPGQPLSLTVPPGALSSDVAFRIDGGQISKVPGYVDVGAPFAVGPAAQTFTGTAQLELPLDTGRLSAAVLDSELLVGWRSATGQVTGLPPALVDRNGGRVTCAVAALGTFWAVAPDVVGAASLFPLNDGDTYRYDDGTVLLVERTAVEPNFAPREVIKASFARSATTTGTYFDDTDGALSTRGGFAVSDWQDVTASAVLLIAARDTVGTIRPVVGSYLGHVPYGASRIGYQGLARTTTEIAERVSVSVPLGVFDTVRVPITIEASESSIGPRTQRVEYWFADGVGPVQIRFGDAGVPIRLVEATVGGAAVVGG